jgi:hypothetical protein
MCVLREDTIIELFMFIFFGNIYLCVGIGITNSYELRSPYSFRFASGILHNYVGGMIT